MFLYKVPSFIISLLFIKNSIQPCFKGRSASDRFFSFPSFENVFISTSFTRDSFARYTTYKPSEKGFTCETNYLKLTILSKERQNFKMDKLDPSQAHMVSVSNTSPLVTGFGMDICFNFSWPYPRSVLALFCAEIRLPTQLQFSFAVLILISFTYCTRGHAQDFIHRFIILTQKKPQNQPYEKGAVFIPILQIRKLRHRV